ncbi:MAG TPA: PP2C family protein-serine/threonine phosphatase [Vicinamibacterales bacterium]|nr:PP2C family protein-serine/threonine phosphatase [Vicinamibacterales bacterium]
MPPVAAPTPADAVLLMLAAVVLAVGLVSLGMTAFHQRAIERSTTAFGAFCLLYGIRLTAATLEAIYHPGSPPVGFEIVRVTATYFILVPVTLFAEQIFGSGWKGSIRGLIYLELAYAAAGVVADVAAGRPGALLPLHPFLVILAAVVLFANALRTVTRASREVQIVEYGLLAFVLNMLAPNISFLTRHRLLFNPEPAGLLVFVCCFGYVAVRRVVHNERRLLTLEHDLETARRIQASILPRRVPEGYGLAIAARYLPMQAVAGDFYDFVPVDRDRLGIFVADVSGHGVGAALIASMLKIAVASQISRAGDPAATLTGLNDTLCGKLERDYVTAAYLLVDGRRGTLTYAGAGHPPPLVRRPATGRVEELLQNGLMLGLFDGATYENLAQPVEPGTRIVLYTDGVVEAATARDEFFGVGRLREFVGGHAALAAGPFADALLQEVARWTGRTDGFDDDLTLIVVDVVG